MSELKPIIEEINEAKFLKLNEYLNEYEVFLKIVLSHFETAKQAGESKASFHVDGVIYRELKKILSKVDF